MRRSKKRFLVNWYEPDNDDYWHTTFFKRFKARKYMQELKKNRFKKNIYLEIYKNGKLVSKY